MKRLTTAFCIALMAILALLSFIACNSNVVRYELVDLEFGSVTVSHYEYNYIEFNYDNGTYELENKVKANGIVSKQKGHFLIDVDNYVTLTNDDVPTQNYLLCPNEEICLEGDKLTIKGSILGFGKVSMTFRK